MKRSFFKLKKMLLVILILLTINFNFFQEDKVMKSYLDEELMIQNFHTNHFINLQVKYIDR